MLLSDMDNSIDDWSMIGFQPNWTEIFVLLTWDLSGEEIRYKLN